MPARPEPLPEIAADDGPQMLEELLVSPVPVVLRGLVAHWPAVRAGRGSAAGAAAYLRGYYRGATVGAWIGPPAIEGRFFYNDNLSGFNFQRQHLKLDAVLDEIERHHDSAQPPAIYVGSTTVDTCLPGFRAHNDLPLGDRAALMSLWLGNKARVSAHFDLPDNLACVVAGRRRFTLFPPEEIENLYVGPLDLTPAGQPVSLVDVARPDFDRFPRYAQALARARTAELGPGDAVFMPSMWWHHVEALDGFNVLVNYWWRQSPGHMDTPMNALWLALLSVRDLPPAQREAWRCLFDHYVFAADAQVSQHIPPPARGALSPLGPDAARTLRARLLRSLNR
jgi:Cupin-like domain